MVVQGKKGETSEAGAAKKGEKRNRVADAKDDEEEGPKTKSKRKK